MFILSIVLSVGAVLVAFLAYQPRFHFAGSLARQPINVRLTGVYPVEGLGSAAQRWSAPRATVRFVGMGSGGYSVLLRFHGGAAAGAGRTLAIKASDGTPLALLPLRPDWQEVALLVPPAAVDEATGDFALTLEVPPLQAAPGDPRSLGIALAHATVTPLEGASTVQLPPWRRVVQLLLAVLLPFVALFLVRVPPLVAALAAATLALAWGLALAASRLDAILLLDIAVRVLPWTVLLAGVMRVVQYVPWGQGTGDKGLGDRTPSPQSPIPSPRYLSPIPSPRYPIPSAVAVAALVIFALRFGGLLHPQYIMIDQKLRANQLVNIAAGRADEVRPQLEQQYEWGTREPIPYSLVTYDLLVPLTWFWKDDDLVKAIAAATSLLDATVPLLLWALGTRDKGLGTRDKGLGTRDKGLGTRSWETDNTVMIQGITTSPNPQSPNPNPQSPNPTSNIQHPTSNIQHPQPSLVALCYAALPVGYLFFHDGSFPTTIGLWFVVVALVGLRWAVGGARSEVSGARLEVKEQRSEVKGQRSKVRGAQQQLHSFSPLAAGRWPRASNRWPRAFYLLPSAFLLLALVAYVTHLAFVPFLVGTLAASLWLLGDDHWAARRVIIVLMLALFGSWLLVYRDYTLTLLQRTIPAFLTQIVERGSVGRDTELLYATAVNTPLQHFQAHFRLWPVLVGAMALVLLLLNDRQRFITHLGLAYTLFMAATLFAEQWFGLWNKHMAFAAPGVALLGGVGLAFLWRRGPAARLVCAFLLAALFWESTLAWGNRVLWYLLPPNAL